MAEDRKGWTAAEIKEIDNHVANGSWTYVDRRDAGDRRIVRLTWAYKRKRDGRLKARLCVQGCSQQPGVDYDQTFCAAMRSSTLRLLCSVAARVGLEMFRWDFVAAYIYRAVWRMASAFTATLRLATSIWPELARTDGLVFAAWTSRFTAWLRRVADGSAPSSRG